LRCQFSEAAPAGGGFDALAEVQALFAFETVFPDPKDIKRKLPGDAEGKEVDVHVQNIEVMWNALQK
jgi:hypothetical protein